MICRKYNISSEQLWPEDGLKCILSVLPEGLVVLLGAQ